VLLLQLTVAADHSRRSALYLAERARMKRRRPVLAVKQQTTIMNTTDGNLAASSNQSQMQESAPAVNKLALESLSKPIGTFGGITDQILRVRHGQAISADTGDQGGGQN